MHNVVVDGSGEGFGAASFRRSFRQSMKAANDGDVFPRRIPLHRFRLVEPVYPRAFRAESRNASTSASRWAEERKATSKGLGGR